MSVNQELAKRFEQIAAMLELTGADPFRVNAHRKAARVIGDSAEDFATLARDRDALLEIEGIGQKTADKIIEFVSGGDIEEHAELREKVPSGLLDVLEIPGLGPKTVKALWEELKVVDVEGLSVIDDGSILTLPRMGAKSVEKIKAAIAFSETSGGRTPLGMAPPRRAVRPGGARRERASNASEFAGSLRARQGQIIATSTSS